MGTWFPAAISIANEFGLWRRQDFPASHELPPGQPALPGVSLAGAFTDRLSSSGGLMPITPFLRCLGDSGACPKLLLEWREAPSIGAMGDHSRLLPSDGPRNGGSEDQNSCGIGANGRLSMELRIIAPEELPSGEVVAAVVEFHVDPTAHLSRQIMPVLSLPFNAMKPTSGLSSEPLPAIPSGSSTLGASQSPPAAAEAIKPPNGQMRQVEELTEAAAAVGAHCCRLVAVPVVGTSSEVAGGLTTWDVLVAESPGHLGIGGKAGGPSSHSSFMREPKWLVFCSAHRYGMRHSLLSSTYDRNKSP